MRIKLILFSEILVILFACQKENDKRNIHVIDMNQIASYELKDVFNVVSINPILTKDSCFLGYVTKAIVFENRLYILDRRQKAIFIYNYDGNLVRKIRKVGRGPGEYLDIVDFTINKYNKQIEMIDGIQLRTYDYSGNYIGKIKIANEKIKAVHQLSIIDSSHIAFLSLFEDNGALIYSRDLKKFVKVQNLVPAWTRDKIPFQTATRFYNNNGEINYYEGFSNKVYQIEKTGFRIKYEWDFKEYNFDYDKSPLINEFKRASSFKDVLQRSDYYTEKYVQTFQHNIENGDYIITCFLFKSKPSTLIYNKKSNKYVIIKGDLSKLLMFSKLEINQANEIFVIADPILLKKMPERWFSNVNAKFIANLSISDNPSILLIKLNEGIMN